MNLQIDIQDQAVTAMLNRLAQSVSNMQPALQEIGQSLADRVTGTFKGSADPWGNKWASLSQTTILRRLGRNKANFKKDGTISKRGAAEAMAGFQPLLDTGRLRSSITYRANANSAEVGTNVVYAAVHQFGARKGAFGRGKRGPIPWGNIPARPFMPIRGNAVVLPNAWRDEVLGILQRRISEATR